jgi:protein RecA
MERSNKLSKQMIERSKRPKEDEEDDEFKGNFNTIISTGSTLLDLAISAGMVRGGGIPGGILVEAFGPSGSGKTVLLCEIAGGVQRQGGEIVFKDPEARLNSQFAKMFGLHVKKENYSCPDTVTDVFEAVRSWEPPSKENLIHGIFTDSLAALSTEMEMGKDGDKMGTRRSKELSQESRKTCRLIKNKNFLMVCSNQVRQNVGAGMFEPKYTTPGGEAIGFYASLRLQFRTAQKIVEKKKIRGEEVKRVIGVESQVEVFKSSIWKPYRSAPLTIIFDYGIDDIRENLKFIKDFSGKAVYTLGGETLSKSLNESIHIVEDDKLEKELKNEVIDLWMEIESNFDSNRKPKR